MTDVNDPSAYGRVWAEHYDLLYEHREDPAEVAAAVAALAPGGSVLELGVGTGRLALPMAETGLVVTGVDASREMLALLQARPGAEKISLIEGDFTAVEAGGPYDVVLIAFSTLFLVPSQEGQLACLSNARAHLRPGGTVIVEAFVPDHSRWTRGQNLSIGHLDADSASLKLSVHDPVRQIITTQEIRIDAGGTTMRPNLLRYVWPAELDALALAAGLRPVDRWGGWGGAPFTATSSSHVSLFQRPAE